MTKRNKPKIRGPRSIINFTQLSLAVGKSQNYFETLNKDTYKARQKFAKMDDQIKIIIDLFK